MMQYEIVLKPLEGYEHVALHKEDGTLVVKTVPIQVGEDKVKHFVKITAEDREKVKKWMAEQEECNDVSTKGHFLRTVKKAVEQIDYDYWIATLEPSRNSKGIYYSEGEEVGVGIESAKWFQLAEEYAPERGSRMSKLTELFMWYALRIVNGNWTRDYVISNSSKAGNYKNAPNSTGNMEKTGARECGGYRDGQGNSYKIVATSDNIFGIVGGDFYNHGNECPVATVFFGNGPYLSKDYGAGVVVLTK